MFIISSVLVLRPSGDFVFRFMRDMGFVSVRKAPPPRSLFKFVADGFLRFVPDGFLFGVFKLVWFCSVPKIFI